MDDGGSCSPSFGMAARFGAFTAAKGMPRRQDDVYLPCDKTSSVGTVKELQNDIADLARTVAHTKAH